MAADADPVATGVVASIARPDGNITGFAGLVPSIGGKWVELLKEVAPGLRRIAIVLIADDAESTYLPSIEAAAAPLGVQAIRIPVRAQYWERLTTRLSKS
jgi:putative ABC transport system substrate-binding protein